VGAADDVEGMRIPTMTAIAVATLLVGAAGADAQEQPTPSAGGIGVIEPADMQPVATEITISDAAGTAVKTLSCEWTEPQEDDMQCIRFQGDPQTAFAAIEEAGGVRADQTVTTRGRTTTTAYSKRFDGTWLIRSHGEINGEPSHWGRVCTADGQVCQNWNAGGAKLAQKKVRAAAAKLRFGKNDTSKPGSRR
jgi:hypothetical protein